MKVKVQTTSERDEVVNDTHVFWMKVKSVSSPIFVSPSKTRMPVGVRPKLKRKSVKTVLNSRMPEDPNDGKNKS